MLSTVVLAAEAAHESSVPSPFLIGGTALGLLLLLLLAVVAIGGGREHS